jgi:DNA-binding NarL/FixJ family response regulator
LNSNGDGVSQLRILIADDHEVLRAGLRNLLEKQSGWIVVGEARDGREAVSKAIELKPDIAVIDISMPSLNGIEATRQIVNSAVPTKVLILTMHESDSLVREVLVAGAQGYVLKNDTAHDLVAAVQALTRNETFFTSKIARMVLDGYLKKHLPLGDGDASAPLLTARQREIVQLITEGKSNKEVAVALGISVKTVDTHRANIMRRLDCHSVSEIVRYAIKNGIVQP